MQTPQIVQTLTSELAERDSEIAHLRGRCEEQSLAIDRMVRERDRLIALNAELNGAYHRMYQTGCEFLSRSRVEVGDPPALVEEAPVDLDIIAEAEGEAPQGAALASAIASIASRVRERKTA